MRWQDIESITPGLERLDSLLTYCAHRALGFTVRASDVKADLRVAYKHFVDTNWRHQHDDASNGAFALIAALEGEWDLAGECTGGPLGNRVVIRKTFGDDSRGLARHLATIARGKLPATHALAAMEELRARFRDGAGDPRIAAIATALFVRDIARADDPVVAARAWLDGEPIELDAARPVAAPADGEDPRVKIFERYAPELSEDATITTALARTEHAEPWERYLERDRLEMDDLVIRAFVARLPLPARWELRVDPLVAAYLGVETPKLGDRLRDLARMRSGWLGRDWNDALFTLVVTKPEQFRDLVERERLPKYKPGQFFKDDARKLVNYLAAAIAVDATEDGVLPAWLDFLARRSPATTPLIAKEKHPLRWKHLLLLQAAVTRKIAKRDRGEVGRALQQTVTGA